MVFKVFRFVSVVLLDVIVNILRLIIPYHSRYPPFRPFFSKTRGGVIYRLFFFGIITVFVLPPKKCLKYWSIKKAKENFRFFFFPSFSNKKHLPVFYLLFFGAKTSQITGKLLKHQEVKTKTSVFFSFSHSRKKTFHS